MQLPVPLHEPALVGPVSSHGARLRKPVRTLAPQQPLRRVLGGPRAPMEAN